MGRRFARSRTHHFLLSALVTPALIVAMAGGAAAAPPPGGPPPRAHDHAHATPLKSPVAPPAAKRAAPLPKPGGQIALNPALKIVAPGGPTRAPGKPSVPSRPTAPSSPTRPTPAPNTGPGAVAPKSVPSATAGAADATPATPPTSDSAKAAPGADSAAAPSVAALDAAAAPVGVAAAVAPVLNKTGLRALVVAVDENDFGLPTWKSMLDRTGAAYDVLLSKNTALTTDTLVRADGAGKYNAILLTDGMLLYAGRRRLRQRPHRRRVEPALGLRARLQGPPGRPVRQLRHLPGGLLPARGHRGLDRRHAAERDADRDRSVHLRRSEDHHPDPDHPVLRVPQHARRRLQRAVGDHCWLLGARGAQHLDRRP